MTTPERPEPHLPERAEALLEGWPAPSRGALEWEDAAIRTMARVRETEPGSTDAALLEAPLPPESGDGELVLSPPEDEPGLADIARAMVATSGTAPGRNVAREMLAAAEDIRAHSKPPAPMPLEARSAPGREPQAVQAHEATARSELPASQGRPRRGGLGLVAIGAGAALALAASAVLYVSLRTGAERGAVAEASAEAPVTARAAAPPARAQDTPGAPEAPKPPPSPVALNALPAADSLRAAQAEPSPKPAAGAAVGTVPNSKDALSFRVKSAASPTEEKLVLEEREDEAPVAAQAAAQAPAVQKGSAANAAEPGLPPEPSLGAVQAAIGAVMSGARSCLAGQDTGSKATLKFGSDGRVTSVLLAGPAAGTPAEGCVRSALLAARVPPFSDPSFSASLTIRPP